MTQQNNEALNKFISGYGFALSDQEYELVKEAWQAAKADSEREVAELKATIELNHALMQADDKEILALQAHINVLREALEEANALNINWSSEAEPHTLEYFSEYRAVIKMGTKALASTPAQSLTERKEQWEARLMAECTDPNQ